MPSFIYAVRVGRTKGLFSSWQTRAECEKQVKGFPNAKYKKFPTEAEANAFLNEAQTGSSKRPMQSDSQSNSKRIKLDTKDVEMKSGDRVVVYTDGCCHNNGKCNARAGLGVFWGTSDHEDNVSERLVGRQTNNRAEIMAVVRAIKIAKKRDYKSLEIRTDSEFLINCITKWMDKWKSNRWMLSKGKPVVNREELEELDVVSQGIQIHYVHVRGHQGEEGNEQADRLANEGARKS
ncbi:hypothetical protein HELRODRAFT_156844 [Helobdella robusta]|uniref:Ribonuclease H n=1 Tax=Helobdella robusta TaxID=6412 RepID=T1EM18_HELRO|nr:hypothetical protein HELRODRAFT_156844 [Helobdella robusta]ESO05691.1 hypothetical protein HELRODRAFT_156844 [Helobdella robusta]